LLSRECDGETVSPSPQSNPQTSAATDGSYLRNAGIPTYGHSGLADDIHEFRAHGKDERVLVKSFFTGSEYLYRLTKALSGDLPQKK
jgi:acetylornithine deacetylase/succinyl-diaminopimelate desuccinylase-like protein